MHTDTNTSFHSIVNKKDVRLYAYIGSMCTYGLHTLHVCMRTYSVHVCMRTYSVSHVCMRKHGVCVDTEDDGVPHK